MHIEEHRRRARIVAIVDLILTVLGSWRLVALFVFAFYLTGHATRRDGSTSTDPDGTDMDPESLTIYMITLWIILVLTCMCTVLELVAATKLYKSTKAGIDTAVAAKSARFWQACTIIFTVFIILSVLTRGRTGSSVIILAINVCLRIIGISVVHSYIKKLDIYAGQTLPTVVPGQPGTTVVYSTSDPAGAESYVNFGKTGQGHVYPSLGPNFAAGYSSPPPAYNDCVTKSEQNFSGPSK